MTAEQRVPGFAFARLLRDPEFRRYLKSHGFVSGTTVAPLGPDDEWTPDLPLLPEGEDDVLVARQDAGARHGWRLRWRPATAAHIPARAVPAVAGTARGDGTVRCGSRPGPAERMD